MLLTVECTKNSDEVEIYCDHEGVELLIKRLLSLRNKPGHEHFMTPSWAGNELTEDKQGGKENILINHLCIAVKDKKI
jgi:translation initiation factor 2 gamma subunit (eIF-2gamma)